LSVCLFGVCAGQCTTYFSSPRRKQDNLTIQSLFLSIFCAAVSVYFIWFYLVDNYFNPSFLASAPWPLTAVPLLSGLSACPVQIFMAYRVLRLSKSRLVFGLMVFLTMANGGIAFATSVLAFGLTYQNHHFLLFEQGTHRSCIVTNQHFSMFSTSRYPCYERDVGYREIRKMIA
ncbi:hypothetical protein R3P38DRAFT_2565964, partial [Favolaschia claudopus]